MKIGFFLLSKRNFAIISGIFFAIVGLNYIFDKMRFAKAETINIDTEVLQIKDNDIIFGKKDAKIVMIEYADFTCYHCVEFFKKHFNELNEKYIQTGKVKFIFRPLVLSQPSLKVAKFLMCKNRSQEENLKILSTLFLEDWSRGGDYTKIIYNLLQSKKIDVSDFYNCINSRNSENIVMKMRLDAVKKLKIPGTPFIFLNNIPVDINSLFSKIDQEINH